MKTIYIDSDFKCHLINDGTMTAIETDFFDGKCDAFIEGYRYIPAGESWTRNDGTVFYGEMISPIKDYGILESVQNLYIQTQVSDEKNEARIMALEEENAALKEENAMLMECILEMSEIVYA